MLSIQSVSKRYKTGNFGVKDFSLNLTTGVVGLLGPNGAGKSTLMQMIATITKPTSGTISFQNVDIAKTPEPLRRTLGYLPQDFGVYDNLTAYEFLNYFASLKGIHNRNRVMEMLEMVNLHSVSNRAVSTFSGGMKQRLGIAQALINNPHLVIVDEPTAGLDPEERVRFRNILSEIGFGKLVILSTHIVSDIESIATEIAIVRQGSLVICTTPEKLLQAAEGFVWEAVLPSAQFDQVRTTLKFSNAVRKSDGIHVRIVAPERPVPQAVTAEANLEDAYLYFMNFYQPGRTEYQQGVREIALRHHSGPLTVGV
ncbi:MAG: ABC transporter ATP-binding protein [Acidobacteria bacterium]|nr:ABC transporter ATP-binding protein [Acidobacteriota bacterium]